MRHVYIAGVDRWPDYERSSLQIDQALTYQIDICQLKVRGTKPNEGDEVIIEDDNLGRLFAGMIVKVDLASTTPDKRVNTWAIDCDDYTAELDRKLVVETYSNVTADFIFRDIAAKYCPGFTVNGVRTGAPTVEELVFDYVYPSDAFKQLCDYVGWQWQPSYYKDLAFYNTDDLAAPAPMTLTPGGQFRNLKHTIDQTGLRNRVYVRGGTMLSNPNPINWKVDGVARIWGLPFGPHDISYNGLVGYIGVGGIAKKIGVENVDDEETNDFLLNFEEKYIKASSNTSTPAASTTISFMAKQDIDVITIAEDLASQQAIAAVQGGDGVYEYVITDDSLTTIEAAEAAGNADLRDHSNPQVKGSFETEVTGWSPGQLVTINLPDRGINGTFLVQKLTIVWDGTSQKWTYQVSYGGRLKGIADVLKALVSAQQKKKLNDTALLHKFTYGQDNATVTDEIIPTVRSPVFYCGDSDAVCGFVECSQAIAADLVGYGN